MTWVYTKSWAHSSLRLWGTTAGESILEGLLPEMQTVPELAFNPLAWELLAGHLRPQSYCTVF